MAAAVGGGDTGRVAERGSATGTSPLLVDFEGAMLWLLGVLVAIGTFSLGMMDPVKIVEFVGADAGAMGSSTPSSSFRRFECGS